MSLALSIWVLFISLMQSVNEAQLLNTTYLLLLLFGFAAGAGAGAGAIIIDPLTSVYASL